MLGADKKCGDATRIIIIGNLRFRIRKTSANFLSELTSLFSYSCLMYLVIVSINSSMLIGLEIWPFMPESRDS